MKRKWKIAAAAVCVVALITVAYAATAGSKEDPLVSLSYLDKVFAPKVEDMAEQAAGDRQNELEAALNDAIEQWDERVEEAISSSGSSNAEGNVFTVVTLNKGQRLEGDVGCEVMLRIGTAKCSFSGSGAGLINTTTGANLANGGALTTNHLYMVTISDRSVVATSNTAKVLVRGPYTIEG